MCCMIYLNAMTMRMKCDFECENDAVRGLMNESPTETKFGSDLTCVISLSSLLPEAHANNTSGVSVYEVSLAVRS